MSFFTRPGRYLREALLARRERVQEERERRNPRVVFGARRNLHVHGQPPPGPEIPEWHSISAIQPPTFVIDPVTEEIQRNARHGRGPHNGDGGNGIGPEEKSSLDFETPSVTWMKSKMQFTDDDTAIVHDPSVGQEHIPLRLIPSTIELPFGTPEVLSEEPVVLSDSTAFWGIFSYHKYLVSKNLEKHLSHQTEFLKRVMSVLTIKVAFIITWCCIVRSCPSVSKPIVKRFNYSYIPLTAFLISKLWLRTMVKIRKMHKAALVIVSVLRTTCLAYYCAAVTAFSNVDVIILTGVLIFICLFFFSFTCFFLDYHLADPETVGMAGLVAFIFGLLIAFPYVIFRFKQETSSIFHILVINWLPSYIASQLMLTFVFFDLKQIMNGWRFALTESDWMFTVLYI